MVARLLGRRVADQVARYMEYHWSPEAFLSVEYSYMNPSTDARGRLAQTAEMQFDAKSYAAGLEAIRAAASDAGRDPASIISANWHIVVTGRSRDEVDEALSSDVMKAIALNLPAGWNKSACRYLRHARLAGYYHPPAH